MPLIWILASALGGAYGAEKVGDWINEKRGVAPQPIYGGPKNMTPAAPVSMGVLLLGAAAAGWWLARK